MTADTNTKTGQDQSGHEVCTVDTSKIDGHCGETGEECTNNDGGCGKSATAQAQNEAWPKTSLQHRGTLRYTLECVGPNDSYTAVMNVARKEKGIEHLSYSINVAHSALYAVNDFTKMIFDVGNHNNVQRVHGRNAQINVEDILRLLNSRTPSSMLKNAKSLIIRDSEYYLFRASLTGNRSSDYAVVIEIDELYKELRRVQNMPRVFKVINKDHLIGAGVGGVLLTATCFASRYLLKMYRASKHANGPAN